MQNLLLTRREVANALHITERGVDLLTVEHHLNWLRDDLFDGSKVATLAELQRRGDLQCLDRSIP